MEEKPKKAPKSSSSSAIVVMAAIVISVVMCVGIAGAVVVLVFKLLEPVSEAGNEFMNAIRDGDYQDVYALVDDRLKSVVEDTTRLESIVLEYDAQPESWNFNSQSIKNNFGEIEGTVTLEDGRTTPLLIQFVQLDGVWRVTYFAWAGVASDNL